MLNLSSEISGDYVGRFDDEVDDRPSRPSLHVYCLLLLLTLKYSLTQRYTVDT